MRRVVLLHLGLPGGAAGSAPRRRVWRETAARLGCEYLEISLLGDHRARLRRPPGGLAALSGRAVPETLVWSPESVDSALADLAPDAVVCETARTFHPRLLNCAPRVVLDFVDRLSVSYLDRAQVARRPDRRLFYRVLASRHRLLEAAPPMHAVAAGRGDAEALGAVWMPNLAPSVEDVHRDESEPEVDLLFFGSLSYPPNVAACRRLARIWPELQTRRPGTTLKIAGRHPAPEVRKAARRFGWTLEENFEDLAALCASTRLAVAPLEHAAGIQNKVLEAAAHGSAQVVSVAATFGFDREHPLCAAETDEEMIVRIIELLDDEPRRRELGARGREWAIANYSVDVWTETARALLFELSSKNL